MTKAKPKRYHKKKHIDAFIKEIPLGHILVVWKDVDGEVYHLGAVADNHTIACMLADKLIGHTKTAKLERIINAVRPPGGEK